MEQSFSDIIVNTIYRTCFKSLVTKHDRQINQKENLALVSCFARLTQAYTIIAPIINDEFKTNRAALWKKKTETESAE